MKFQPYVNVNVCYDLDIRKEGLEFDKRLEGIAARLGGNLSGSGYGPDGRDIGFIFRNLTDAREFYLFAKKFKGVGEIESNSVLHDKDN